MVKHQTTWSKLDTYRDIIVSEWMIIILRHKLITRGKPASTWSRYVSEKKNVRYVGCTIPEMFIAPLY